LNLIKYENLTKDDKVNMPWKSF